MTANDKASWRRLRAFQGAKVPGTPVVTWGRRPTLKLPQGQGQADSTSLSHPPSSHFSSLWPHHSSCFCCGLLFLSPSLSDPLLSHSLTPFCKASPLPGPSLQGCSAGDIKPRSPNPQSWTWPKKTRVSWLQVGSSCHLVCRACTTSPTPVPTAPGPVPPVRIESSSSTVAEGQTLDLSCVVAGQAHAQVTWYKRDGSLPARHQVHVVRKVGGGSQAEPWTVVCRGPGA